MVEERQRYQTRTSPIFVGDDVAEDDDTPLLITSDIDSPPEDDYIVNVGDLEEDDADGSEDDGEPPAWYTSQQTLQQLRDEHRRHENDTGSPEFQVAGMTERINYLTKHLQNNPKDFSTRRGLVAMVNKRRRLLNWLSKEDEQRYSSLVQALGIRHKAPGRVSSREEKYSRFPRQKAVKKHLTKK
jgi:small subunit ribosomal protein S15